MASADRDRQGDGDRQQGQGSALRGRMGSPKSRSGPSQKRRRRPPPGRPRRPASRAGGGSPGRRAVGSWSRGGRPPRRRSRPARPSPPCHAPAATSIRPPARPAATATATKITVGSHARAASRGSPTTGWGRGKDEREPQDPAEEHGVGEPCRDRIEPEPGGGDQVEGLEAEHRRPRSPAGPPPTSTARAAGSSGRRATT